MDVKAKLDELRFIAAKIARKAGVDIPSVWLNPYERGFNAMAVTYRSGDTAIFISPLVLDQPTRIIAAIMAHEIAHLTQPFHQFTPNQMTPHEREYDADRKAVSYTNDPEALVQALELTRSIQGEQFNSLDHPPVSKRIALVQQAGGLNGLGN